MKRFIYIMAMAGAVTLQAQAQNSNDQKARHLYPKAVELFTNGEYKAAQMKVTEMEKLLGKGNARLFYLRTKIAYESADYAQAQEACKSYFESRPKHDPGYEEMLVIKESILAYNQARQQQRAEAAAAWEQAEMERKQRAAEEERQRKAQMQAAAERRAAYQQVQDKIDEQESQRFKEVQKTNTKEAYQLFLYDYPNGKLFSQAKKEMEKKWPSPVRSLSKNKYGYTKDGKFIVKPIYEYASDFCEGLARVGKEGKYGFVNEAGKLIVPLDFIAASNFNYGSAAVKNTNNEAYFIMTNGQKLNNEVYLDTKSFSEGLAACQDNNYLYGFINKAGELKIQHAYNSVSWFKEGICSVSKVIDGKTKYAYIDNNGTQLCDFIYDEAKDFQGGVARVKMNGKYGLVDRFGAQITCCDYDQIYEFKGDGYALAKRNNLEVFLDKEGQCWAKVNGKYVKVQL